MLPVITKPPFDDFRKTDAWYVLDQLNSSTIRCTHFRPFLLLNSMMNDLNQADDIARQSKDWGGLRQYTPISQKYSPL